MHSQYMQSGKLNLGIQASKQSTTHQSTMDSHPSKTRFGNHRDNLLLTMGTKASNHTLVLHLQ